MFFQWRTLQVMLQAGASHKTAGYRNGSIKTLSTTIKKEKSPFYTRKSRKIVISQYNYKKSAPDIFKATYCQPKSRKRKQKQNKREAKKAKENKMKVNCNW